MTSVVHPEAGTDACAADEIIPLRQGDNAKAMRDSILNLTLWFSNTLDVTKLCSALDRLLEIGHWRVLGARLRMGANNKLEYRVPQKYSKERPGYLLTTTSTHTKSPLEDKLAALEAGTSRPTVVCTTQELDDLVRNPERHVKLEDWLHSDSPQLTVHVVAFSNATAITLTWPHTLCDLVGIGLLLRAFSVILDSREDEVSVLTAPGKEYLESLTVSATPADRWIHFHRQLPRWTTLRLGLRLVIEKMFSASEEARLVRVPCAFMKQLHARANIDLDAETPAHHQEDTSLRHVSESDVLFAWWARTLCTALNLRPSQTVILFNVFDMRPALSETYLPSDMSYFGNAVATSATVTTAGQVLCEPVSFLAAQIRQSLLEARTVEQIEAMGALGWTTAGVPMTFPRPIGDGSDTLFVVCSNWGKVGLFDVDLAGAATAGGTRTEASPILQEQRRAGGVKPAFVHATVSHRRFSGSKLGHVFGKDGQGNWWLSWSLRADLWPRLESVMEGMDSGN